MRTSHVARSYGRRWLVAGALCWLSLSAFAGVGRDRATGQAIWDSAINGRTTNIGTDGGAWKVIGPATTSAGSAAGSAKISGTATATVDGTKVPVSVSSGDITKGTIANVVAGCLTGGYVGCAITVAMPFAMQWMATSSVRINSTTGANEVVPAAGSQGGYCYVSPCYLYDVDPPTGAPGEKTRDLDKACASRLLPTGYTHVGPVYPGSCQRRTNTGTLETFNISKYSTTPMSPTWVPGTPQNIRDALYVNNPPIQIVDELAKFGNINWPGCPGGVCPPLSSPLNPVVSGPSSIAKSSTTVKTMPDGSTVTTTTSQTLTYSGPNVTAGPITETEISRNPSGVTTGTTTTVKTPPTEPDGGSVPPPEEKEDPPVQCDKYPNSLGCSELDTPSGEIPKENKTLTYAAESPFGGGSCPADRMFSSYMTGRTYKAWDFAQTCSYIATYVRPLVLLLATFAAFLIIMPGKVET